ncbi:MAG: hypothetical protein JWM11_3747, partial [Planctomycetaceae bacterium]|nr:hypothetical protein [Planctomycetaceae bacterium]
MRAKFKCPDCEAAVVIDTATVGAAITCDHCGKLIKIKRTSATPSDSAEPEQSKNRRSDAASKTSKASVVSDSADSADESSEFDNLFGDQDEVDHKSSTAGADEYGTSDEEWPDDLPKLELKKKKKKKVEEPPPPPPPPKANPLESLLKQQPKVVMTAAGAGGGFLFLFILWLIFGGTKKPQPAVAGTTNSSGTVSSPDGTVVATPGTVETAAASGQNSQRTAGTNRSQRRPEFLPPDWSKPEIDAEQLAVKYGRPIDEWIAMLDPPAPTDKQARDQWELLQGDKEQLRAINALGVFRSQAPKVLTALMPRLASAGEETRQTVRDAVLWLKPQPQELLPHITPLLASPTVFPETVQVAILLKAEGLPFRDRYRQLLSDERFKDAAIKALEAIGSADVPSLLKQLDEEMEPTARDVIIGQLRDMGSAAQAATDKLLVMATTTPQPIIAGPRRAPFQPMSARPGGFGNPQLGQANVLGALAAIAPEDPRVQKLILDSVQQKQWTNVYVALFHLGKPVPSLQSLLLEIPLDGQWALNLKPKLVAQFPPQPESIPRLISWTFKNPAPDPNRRSFGQTSTAVGEMVAREVIAQIGDDAIPALIEITKSKDPVLKRGALSALIWLKSPATLAPLLAYAEQEFDPQVIREILIAVAPLRPDPSRIIKYFAPGSTLSPNDQRALAEVIQLPVDKTYVENALKMLVESRNNPQMASAAINLLQSAGPLAANALPDLITYLRANPTDPQVYDAVTNIGAPAVPELLKIWTANEVLQQNIMYRFGMMGVEGAAAIPEFVKRMQDPMGFSKNISPEEPIKVLAQILRDQRSGKLPDGLSEESQKTLVGILGRASMTSTSKHAGTDEILMVFEKTTPLQPDDLCRKFFERLKDLDRDFEPLPNRISTGERKILENLLTSQQKPHQVRAAALLFCAGDDQPRVTEIIQNQFKSGGQELGLLTELLRHLQTYQIGFGPTAQARVGKLLRDFVAKSDLKEISFVEQPYPRIQFGQERNSNPRNSRIRPGQRVVAPPESAGKLSPSGMKLTGERFLSYQSSRREVDHGLEAVKLYLAPEEPLSPANWELLPKLYRMLQQEGNDLQQRGGFTEYFSDPYISMAIWNIA